MVVRTKLSPFGSQTRTCVLQALQLLTESYARELARLLARNLSSVQRALQSLERDGMLAARPVGRTRVYRLNPGVFARRELEAYLERLLEAEPELRSRAATLRRRARMTGKRL